MILKMYIADQLCYEYIFEPHFRWYESMILLTLLTPCIYLVLSTYIHISFIMVFFHPYHDKKIHFLFCMDRPSKKTIYLPQIKQSLFEPQLKGLWVVCWITNHWWYTSVHSFWLSFPLCNHTFIQGSRSHRSAQ